MTPYEEIRRYKKGELVIWSENFINTKECESERVKNIEKCIRECCYNVIKSNEYYPNDNCIRVIIKGNKK